MSLSTEAASTAADAVLALCDGGRLRIFGPNLLLADLALPSPAFNRAVSGSATALPIPSVYAKQTGTAATFEVVDSEGQTVFDGDVGLKNADLILNRVKIVTGARVAVTALIYTQQRG